MIAEDPYGILALVAISLTALGALVLGGASLADSIKLRGMKNKSCYIEAPMWSAIGVFLVALMLGACCVG